MKVSRICLGCMTYGSPATGELKAGRRAWALNEEQIQPFLRQALDFGINFFDTANNYSSGNSERVLGNFLKANTRREAVVDFREVWGHYSKHIEFISVPECGHLPNEEKPMFVTAALLKFLSPWKG